MKNKLKKSTRIGKRLNKKKKEKREKSRKLLKFRLSRFILHLMNYDN